jgi:hypothetical protein
MLSVGRAQTLSLAFFLPLPSDCKERSEEEVHSRVLSCDLRGVPCRLRSHPCKPQQEASWLTTADEKQ